VHPNLPKTCSASNCPSFKSKLAERKTSKMITTSEMIFIIVLSYFALMALLVDSCHNQITQCLEDIKKANAIAKQNEAAKDFDNIV